MSNQTGGAVTLWPYSAYSGKIIKFITKVAHFTIHVVVPDLIDLRVDLKTSLAVQRYFQILSSN